jgi:hypothetical protein
MRHLALALAALVAAAAPALTAADASAPQPQPAPAVVPANPAVVCIFDLNAVGDLAKQVAAAHDERVRKALAAVAELDARQQALASDSEKPGAAEELTRLSREREGHDQLINAKVRVLLADLLQELRPDHGLVLDSSWGTEAIYSSRLPGGLVDLTNELRLALSRRL